MIAGPKAPVPKSPTVHAALVAAEGSRNGLIFVDLQERETKLTWPEIHQRARKAAAHLRAHGVSAGDRVAIILPTSPEFADSFFGILLAGAVPVPLYPPVRLGRLEEYYTATVRMIAVCGAVAVVSDARVRKLLGQVIERAAPRLGLIAAEDLSSGTEEFSAPAVGSDLGLIQFSSGSTVDPKAVALTHDNLMSQCASLYTHLIPNAGAEATGVCWLPLYHDMGLIGCLLSALYYPGNLVLISPEIFLAKPALWLRAISRHKAIISPAPDFAYALCAKRVKDVDLVGVDLSAWLAALNGAEPISPQSLRAFTERFRPYGLRDDALRPVYGLSEASLAVTASSPPFKAREGTICVGAPVPGFEVKICDARGERKDGEIGRIFTRGPSVMRGYFGDDAATRKAIREGWLDTGDLGFIAEGELYVTGRDKDIIIIRGANHGPQQFEACLLDVAGVRTGCAVALGLYEESGEAVLVLAERAAGAGAERDADTIAAITHAILSGTGIKPGLVRMLTAGTLPRTSSGKLRRSEALRRYRAGSLSAPTRVALMPLVAAMLRSQLAMARARVRRLWQHDATV